MIVYWRSWAPRIRGLPQFGTAEIEHIRVYPVETRDDGAVRLINVRLHVLSMLKR